MKKIQRIVRIVTCSTLSMGIMFNAVACQAHASRNGDPLEIQHLNQSNTGKKIQIALLLDTSNSMDGLINQAKSQLWAIVNDLSKAECDGVKPELQIALYHYGNDGLNSETGYIQQVTGFTSELDLISEKLFSLSTNGGSEYCGWVIDKAVKDLTWGSNEKDLKMIFICGNEEFTQGQVNFTTSCLSAKQKDIAINTIFCGDINEGIRGQWKKGADLGEGSFMAINHNEATTYITTPFDNRIDSLNYKLNDTYIYYGSQGKTKYENQKKQDDNAGTLSKEIKVERSVSKSSSFYKNDSWDLVDKAEKEGASKAIQEAPEATLPEEMKGLSADEKQKYVQKKAEERKQIQIQIAELNKQRTEYISKNSQQSSQNLNAKMTESIKEKAKTKNYQFK